MKITTKHYLQDEAEAIFNGYLEMRDWEKLAELTDPTLTPRYKDLVFTITIIKDQLKLLPDFIKDRILIKY
jgi:hypothetical protein